MTDRTYSEAQAAAMLPLPMSARTLKRWRQGGKVPFGRTPGGRIFYTFAQLAEIGAAMMTAAGGPSCPEVAPIGPDCPDMSGEMLQAAE